MRYRCRTMLAALVVAIAMVALTAGTALASGKPTAETKPATSIGETTATLHGSVNPNGATTKYHFEYGTTISYGKSTAEVSVGSGSSYLEESSAITALSASTSYHFRIVATNSNGTTDGADQAFSTLEKPGLPEFVLGTGETFPVKLEGAAHTSITFKSEGATWLTCTQGNFKGEITSGKKVTATNELTGCTAAGVHCNTIDAPNGVVTLSGSGSLVYIEKSTKKVGVVLALKPATIECAGFEELWVRGSLLAPVTPINTKTKSFELPYREGKELGKEEFTKYENEKGEVVKATPELNAGGQFIPMVFGSEPLALTASKTLTIGA